MLVHSFLVIDTGSAEKWAFCEKWYFKPDAGGFQLFDADGQPLSIVASWNNRGLGEMRAQYKTRFLTEGLLPKLRGTYIVQDNLDRVGGRVQGIVAPIHVEGRKFLFMLLSELVSSLSYF